jgi:hypothetical protein
VKKKLKDMRVKEVDPKKNGPKMTICATKNEEDKKMDVI